MYLLKVCLVFNVPILSRTIFNGRRLRNDLETLRRCEIARKLNL